MLERHIKERLTGASVLVLLGVIFIPMVLDNSSELQMPVRTNPPAQNDSGFQSRIIPVDEITETDAKPQPVTVDREIPIQADTQEISPAVKPVSEVNDISTNNSASESNSVADKVVQQTERKLEPGETQGLSGWVVQLGSFSNQANAEGLVSSLQSQGYPAYIEKITGDSESIFRVRVGPEINRENAEKTQQALIGKTGMKGIILSYP